MEIVKKPDIRVFASEAKSGEVVSFPDVLRGWGVTLDQTQGKPPLEWMNDAFNRVDLNNLYLLQQGVPEWDKTVRYPVNSIIKHAGKIYLCIAENENNEPSSDSSKWSLYVKNATTAQKGIVQLTNNIDDSEDKAITPRAINELRKEMFDAMPVGVIVSWDHAVAPKNWLFVRDQKFSATEYPELAKLYPSLTLNDRRGTVDRALDAGRGFDSGRVLGSYQEDTMQVIKGGFDIRRRGEGTTPTLGLIFGEFGAMYSEFQNVGSGSTIIGTGAGTTGGQRIAFDSSRQTRTAIETRMKNVATNKIIKAR